MRGPDPTNEKNPSAGLTTPGAGMAAGAMAMGGMTPDGSAMPGMDHSAMNHGAMATGGSAGGMAGMDHSSMGGQQGMAGMDMGSMKMRDFSKAPQVKKGPGVQTISPMPMDRTGDPGQGLETVGHKVLVYRDLMALDAQPGRARAQPQPRHSPDRQHGALHVVVRRREDVRHDGADPLPRR